MDDNGKEHVIAYASKSLTDQERNWSTTEREAFAVVWSTDKFRCYLLGQEFTLVTDHQALKWLFNRSNPTGKIAHWIFRLQEYQYKVVYRPEKTHQNADALSRLPQEKKQTQNNLAEYQRRYQQRLQQNQY